MKIAVVSDDGETISEHFGRARCYVVLTIEDGEVVALETRARAGHSTFTGHSSEEHDPVNHGVTVAAHKPNTRLWQRPSATVRPPLPEVWDGEPSKACRHSVLSRSLPMYVNSLRPSAATPKVIYPIEPTGSIEMAARDQDGVRWGPFR